MLAKNHLYSHKFKFDQNAILRSVHQYIISGVLFIQQIHMWMCSNKAAPGKILIKKSVYTNKTLKIYQTMKKLENNKLENGSISDSVRKLVLPLRSRRSSWLNAIVVLGLS